MAKPGVTYEEVIAAAQDLEKSGEKLSVNRIREVLGNRASIASINRFIKDWKGQPEAGQASETMQQQPLNLANEDEGNQAAAGTSHSEGGQDESNSASEPVRSHAKTASPFDEPKETCQPERLEDLDDNALIIKIRRLETLLSKEQSRREAAEKMAEEAKEYADIIKEQIGQRVADLKQSMEVIINQLKAEAREMKHNADSDLKFYREQLQKANVKILSLLTGQAPAEAPVSAPESTSTKDSTDSVSE
jgi:hypothetical protein